jgi:hypothetical protein
VDKFLRVSNRIILSSSKWVVLSSTIIFLIFVGTVLPDQALKAEIYSAEIGSPDLSLFYSPADLYQMAEVYGSSGREAYVRARFSFDLLFPMVYGAFLLFTIAWGMGKTTGEKNHKRLLVFIPLLAVLFDLLENTFAAFVIGRYPQPSGIIAMLAPFFTLFKWVFVGFGFALSFVLVFQLVWEKTKK